MTKSAKSIDTNLFATKTSIGGFELLFQWLNRIKKMSKRKVLANSPETWMMNKKAELEEEKERNPPKSLFIILRDKAWLPTLTRTDVHSGSFHHQVVPLDFPDRLDYGVVVLGSKFYFMGGHSRFTTNNRHQLIVFNTVSVVDLQNPSLWETVQPMKLPRIPSVVFAYKNNIYVFGSAAHHEHGIWFPCTELTRESYAEYYDPVSDKWSYLPPAYPPQEIVEQERVQSHTLNEEAGVVYIWFADCEIYKYNLEAKTWDKWLPFKDSLLHPMWSRKVVCLRNFLIWHCFGTIYSFCLSDARLFHLYQVEGYDDPNWQEGYLPDSYLLDVGNGKLCLIDEYQHAGQKTEDIKCHVFSVKFSGSPPDDVQIELQYENSKALGVDDRFISDVLTVGSEIMESMKKVADT